MYCTKDCSCSLCRELRDYKPAKGEGGPNRSAPRLPNNSILGRLNGNFILRRRNMLSSSTPPSSLKTFQPQSLKCSEMLQATNNIINRFGTTTPSPTPINELPLCDETDCHPTCADEITSAKANHKVVIYFGDSIANRGNKPHPTRNDTPSPRLESPDPSPAPLGDNNSSPNRDLPSFIESIENGIINIKIESNYQRANALVATVSKPTLAVVGDAGRLGETKKQKTSASKGSRAIISRGLVMAINNYDRGDDDSNDSDDNGDDDDDRQPSEDTTSEAYDSCDWSFVQQWRTRPMGNLCQDNSTSFASTPGQIGSQLLASNMSANIAPQPNISSGHNVSSGCQQNSAVMVAPTPRLIKEVAQRLESTGSGNGNSNVSFHLLRGNGGAVAGASGSGKQPNLPHRSFAGPARQTIQSTQVKSQPPMLSTNLSQQQNTSPSAQPSSQLSKSQLTTHHQSMLKASSTSPGEKLSTAHLSNISIGIPTEPGFQPNDPTMIATAATHHSPRSGHKPNIPPSCSTTSTHHHEFRVLQRLQECHSSSDENRSSGHASMSDTGGHGSSSPGVGGATLGPLPEDRLAAGVTNRSTRSRASTNHSRPRHRSTPAKAPWSGSGLEDIKLAIQQLTMRSQTSTSTYSSLSAGSESSEPARRLGCYSSMETVNTNVTTAEEFVWVDSHNRLVELQHPPWSQHCILRVIHNGRCKEQAERVAVETVPRLGYLLQRALVRLGCEVRRLSSGLGLCSKQEVTGAFRIVLCPALSDSCMKACLRAAAMFAVPGDSALKQSKSARAGLHLSVGRFHRWMVDARLGNFIHEYAVVYLCAGIENLLEEILLQSFPSADSGGQLTASALEHAIASSGDFWGLLQPFAHLNAGRVASGALTMPRWASQSSIGSSSVTHHNAATLEPCLLTTCVGSIGELKDLTLRAQQKLQHMALSSAALVALFYFMRCSQLEHSEVAGVGGIQNHGGVVNGESRGGGAASGNTGPGRSSNVQELCYERAYVVLPPLVEWLRVASAHAEYRCAVMIDRDDIMQAARLLLPGVDCPVRPIGYDEELPMKKAQFTSGGSSALSVGAGATALSLSEDSTEWGRRATTALAFKLMLTGRAELLAQASSLLPTTTRYDSLNHAGMTALMIASLRNDEQTIQALLDAGCDPNVEVPSSGQSHCPAIHPDTQHWTAMTFAACRGNYGAVRVLLERGGRVEGGARLSEERTTLTPLQVASGSGNVEIVSLLLAHGANAFLSTQQRDSMCFAGSAQRGCYCAFSVAAAHGQRAILRKLLSHPMAPGARDVLSLEEMLAEGDLSGKQAPNERNASAMTAGVATAVDATLTLNKTQIKSLQEAMYHSAENNHLDITIELRTLGVPWTLHCWMHALAAAHDLRLDAVIDQLLQDFLQVCPDDYSTQFVSDCLPLLFNIFRYSKNEGTTLLLADIFVTCFGWENIKPIKELTALQSTHGVRIDPKFVNNPELSDVTFRVEGKIFYGHKIVLVTASPRFQNMLSSKLSDGSSSGGGGGVNSSSSTPTVQINDIRYHIFQLVMQYLYSGGCGSLDISPNDVFELMAAASFFQLEALLRYTELRCSQMIDVDNVVAMYIHAKVYNANTLLEYCQGFLLQNMVALLTYDDSVKRLLFAKKIPNHDVLSGLLQTLQQRIKQRKPHANFRQQLSGPIMGGGGGNAESSFKI